MTNPKQKIAHGKASRKYTLLSLLVAGIIIAESALLSFEQIPVWAQYAIALAHIPFTILVATLGWRALKELDEMQRLIHMQAFIIGVTGSGAILITYTLLVSVGLVSGQFTWYFWAFLWIIYSLSYAFVTKKMS